MTDTEELIDGIKVAQNNFTKEQQDIFDRLQIFYTKYLSNLSSTTSHSCIANEYDVRTEELFKEFEGVYDDELTTSLNVKLKLYEEFDKRIVWEVNTLFLENSMRSSSEKEMHKKLIEFNEEMIGSIFLFIDGSAAVLTANNAAVMGAKNICSMLFWSYKKDLTNIVKKMKANISKNQIH